MTWRKASEHRIGNYTWWDSEMESPGLLPLLECLSYALLPNAPLDRYLRVLFTGDENSPTGGDPGWMWWRERGGHGRWAYHVWIDEDLSGLHPNEGTYDEQTVKYQIYRTLVNFAAAHDDRQDEVNEVIQRYHLKVEPPITVTRKASLLDIQALLERMAELLEQVGLNERASELERCKQLLGVDPLMGTSSVLSQFLADDSLDHVRLMQSGQLTEADTEFSSLRTELYTLCHILNNQLVKA